MNPPIEHPIDKAARVIGSASALARLLGITKGAVSQYKDPDRQVKAEHCPIIERETRARGEVVRCEELRPDVDWAALRTTNAPELATAAPAQQEAA
ncbi:transcriptional regulator [Achromobacter xylosoxidans]|uniref:transcriptional regulator n=1 Tax=Alcaligenes xylosoxydans xylosoxydans TaxID=85698 RepID=UPI0005F8D9EE|nr:YdaS family helix-turn-helix protein [Achromobacter xylosoxidans]